MTALLAIGWAFATLFSVVMIYASFSNRGLTQMFPEGRRWYHAPLRLLSLALFAALVLFNPWK